MRQHTRKSKKRLPAFISSAIFLVVLSLMTAACTNIPVGIGLGLAGGLGYYALQEVHGDEDKVVEKNRQTDIEGSESAAEGME